MRFTLLVLALVFSTSSFAMNGKTTYTARIVKPDGSPLTAPVVHFRFSILDSVGSCVLYIEEYAAINMSGGVGLVSFNLGNGNRIFPVAGNASTFQNTFDNSIAMFNCQAPGTYNPGPTDTRKVVMQFNDGLGWQTLPAMTINAVPYAMYADKSNDAKTLNGKSDAAFVEYSTLAGLSCASDQAIKFNGATFSCISVGSGVTSSTVVSALGYTPASGSSFTALNSTISSVSSTLFLVSSTVTSLSNSIAASFAAISGAGISSLNGSTSATQSFAIGFSGTAPAFNTVNGIHTLNIPYASVGTTTAGLISNADYLLFSTVIGKITSSAASVEQVLGYTPGSSSDISTLAIGLTTVSAAANSAQMTANSVSSTVDTLSATVANKITSGVASISQVLGYTPLASGSVVSSQWSTSGTTINYLLGSVGVGVLNPTAKLQISGGTSLTAALKISSGTLLSSPADGAVEYDGLTLYYTDSTNTRRALASVGGHQTFSGNQTFTGQTAIQNNTSSISSSTGALIVSGGVGIGGSLNIAGQSNVSGSSVIDGTLRLSSMTSGSVFFAGLSGLVSEDNSKFFWDDVNNRLGLGTNLPVNTLSVSGTSYLSGNVGIGTASPGKLLQVGPAVGSAPGLTGPSVDFFADLSVAPDDNHRNVLGLWDTQPNAVGAGGGLMMGSRDSGGSNLTGAMIKALRVSTSSSFNHHLGFYTRNSSAVSEKMRITDAGNVGIGASSPQAKLDVAGDMLLSANPSRISFGALISNSFIQGTNTGGYLIFGTNGSEVSRFSNDSLGIGTTSPQSRLHIAGTNRTLSLAGTAAPQGAPSYFLMGNSDSFGVTGPTVMLSANRSVQFGVGDSFSSPTGGNFTSFMTIAHTGNVGIGTSSPSFKLQINESSAIDSQIGFSNVSGTSRVGVRGSGNAFLYAEGGKALELWSGASQNMTISETGNVGIGTTTPTTRFQVVSSNLSNAEHSVVRYYNANDSGKGLQYSYEADGVSVTAARLRTYGLIPFYLGTSGNNSLLALVGNNVGVGTTTPGSDVGWPSPALDIAGTRGTAMIRTTAASGISTLRFVGTVSAGNDLHINYRDATGALTFDQQAGAVLSALTIAKNGNIGVGTATPNFNLHVNTSSDSGFRVSRTGFSGSIKAGIADGGGEGISSVVPDDAFIINDGGAFAFGTAASHAVKLGTNGLERVRIDSAGLMGIGTSAPSERLHVAGNLRVQGTTDCILGNGSGGTNCSSDIRLKEKINPIPEALNKILGLRGVEFVWNEKSQSPGRKDIGVIAQEVEKNFPTAVITDHGTGFKKVDYAVLVAPLIEAVKQLFKEIIQTKLEIRMFASEIESKADKKTIELLQSDNDKKQKEIDDLKQYLCSKDLKAPFCRP